MNLILTYEWTSINMFILFNISSILHIIIPQMIKKYSTEKKNNSKSSLIPYFKNSNHICSP